MDRQIIVIVTDKRQEKLVDLLSKDAKSYVWEEKIEENNICEKIYVLPTPTSKIDNNKAIKEKLKEELINMRQNPWSRVKVFGGAFGTEWKLFFEEYQIPYWDFMSLPEVVEGNGLITAEATVAEVLTQSEYSISGQKILVTGYGCCGEKIAKLFSKLGAQVMVAARRKEVRQRIREDGFLAIDFSEMECFLCEMDTVINTVPAMVITESCIKKMSQNACIVDIASAPGGTDFDAAKKYGITAKLALGLPGIYTTRSSATLLKNAILKYAPLQNEIREDKSWIFQIII